MLYKGKLDQIIMCLYVEVICKIQTMYVTNLRSVVLCQDLVQVKMRISSS